MRDVNISQYYGFAIVAVNLPNGTLDTININKSVSIQISLQYGYSSGSGVFLLFEAGSYNTPSFTLISNFNHNYESTYYPQFKCPTDYYKSYFKIVSHQPVIYAPGLTIVYA